MAYKTSSIVANMRRNRARSATAKIVNEEINEGFLTRTSGNESINVEIFTPTDTARNSGKRAAMFIEVDGKQIFLNGRNARTIYRVLANHYGPIA